MTIFTQLEAQRQTHAKLVKESTALLLDGCNRCAVGKKHDDRDGSMHINLKMPVSVMAGVRPLEVKSIRVSNEGNIALVGACHERDGRCIELWEIRDQIISIFAIIEHNFKEL